MDYKVRLLPCLYSQGLKHQWFFKFIHSLTVHLCMDAAPDFKKWQQILISGFMYWWIRVCEACSLGEEFVSRQRNQWKNIPCRRWKNWILLLCQKGRESFFLFLSWAQVYIISFYSKNKIDLERSTNYTFNTSKIFLCVQVPLLKFHSEEPAIWSRMNHKNVVSLYGVLRRGQKIYFLEEFIDGELPSFTNILLTLLAHCWWDSKQRLWHPSTER